MTYAAIMQHLEQGPRIKNDATKDLEEVARIFLDPSKDVQCRYNSYGELEVKAGSKIFNLTQILMHQPDFEHFAFKNKEMKQYETFISSAKNIPSLKGSPRIPTEKDYIDVDPKQKFVQLQYAEKLAITLYTSEFYKQINTFLRTNGQEKELKKLNNPELTQLVKELILGTCLASHGLTRLSTNVKQTEEVEFETLYRAENSRDIPSDIIEERMKNMKDPKNPVRHQGFTSTSQSLQAMKISGTDTTIEITQPLGNSIGKDVSDLSYKENEAESLFVPSVQFVYSDYFHGSRKKFQVTPVRSLDGINPKAYSSADAAVRGQLIEAKRDLTDDLNTLHKPSSFSLSRKLLEKLKPSQDKKLISLEKKMDYMIQVFGNSQLHSEKQKRELLASFYQDVVKLKKNGVNSPGVSSLAKMAYKLVIDYELHDQSELIKHADVVYKRHLSKPYHETDIDSSDDKIKIEEEEIHRPNHGLAHSLRVASYIPVVTEYFKDFAQPGLKEFCSGLSAQKIKDLQLCMLFSVSGRESDISFSNNPKKYREYRQNCVRQFEQYAKEIKMNSNDIKKYSALILNMGNPEFLEKNKSPEMINMFHIMNLAHKLDLMRCYQVNAYTPAIKKGHDYLVEESEEQQNGLNHLYKVVSARISATGDRQFCTFDENRKMIVPVNHGYDKVFLTASRDPRECLSLCTRADLDRPESETPKDLRGEQVDKKTKEIKSIPKISTEEMGYYLKEIIEFLGKAKLEELGISKLAKLPSDLLIVKITQNENDFTVFAESAYSEFGAMQIPLSIDEMNQIISKMNPMKLPLPCDEIAVLYYLDAYKNTLEIKGLSELDSSYSINKIERTNNLNEFKVIAESNYETNKPIEIVITGEELQDIVQRQTKLGASI